MSNKSIRMLISVSLNVLIIVLGIYILFLFLEARHIHLVRKYLMSSQLIHRIMPVQLRLP